MLDKIKQWCAEKAVKGLIQSLVALIGIAYYPLVIACVVLIIIYGCGYRKAGKWALMDFVIYFLLECVKGGLLQINLD